jgi:hypothetical protein
LARLFGTSRQPEAGESRRTDFNSNHVAQLLAKVASQWQTSQKAKLEA